MEYVGILGCYDFVRIWDDIFYGDVLNRRVGEGRHIDYLPRNRLSGSWEVLVLQNLVNFSLLVVYFLHFPICWFICISYVFSEFFGEIIELPFTLFSLPSLVVWILGPYQWFG